MHRYKLLTLLKDHKPFDTDENRATENTINFINSNSDCFQRENLTGHLTASAWIINRDNSGIILTRHRKLNKWIQCGGHADGESDLAVVALREAAEETGLKSIVLLSSTIFDVDVHAIPAHQQTAEHIHYDIRFLFAADENESLIVSDESIALAWIPLSELANYTSNHSILRMVIKSRLRIESQT